jgi:hypothetical protein
MVSSPDAGFPTEFAPCRPTPPSTHQQLITKGQIPSRSIGFARAFARRAQAATVALRTDSRRFPLAPYLPRNNCDRGRHMLHNATSPMAPDAFPRALAACTRHFFALTHDPFPPDALRQSRTLRLACFKLESGTRSRVYLISTTVWLQTAVSHYFPFVCGHQ